MLTIMLSILVVSGYANEQNKPGKLNFLCGSDFISIHQILCRLKLGLNSVKHELEQGG